MKVYLKMIVFVFILGSIASLLILGMDALTSERIEQNRQARLQSTILNAFNIEFTQGNINQVFTEKINVVEIDANDDDGNLTTYVFYQDEQSGLLAFIFSGDGVWGPIIGVLTLESDLQTISSIQILQQEETPGLGGVVADPKYLENYVGVQMVPEILISRSPGDGENEVDAISGATRTSNAFQTILNTNYQKFIVSVWQQREA
jgi:Na+-transporting NADH:ubiquinone oxidoreductase subunit C